MVRYCIPYPVSANDSFPTHFRVAHTDHMLLVVHAHAENILPFQTVLGKNLGGAGMAPSCIAHRTHRFLCQPGSDTLGPTRHCGIQLQAELSRGSPEAFCLTPPRYLVALGVEEVDTQHMESSLQSLFLFHFNPSTSIRWKDLFLGTLFCNIESSTLHL